MGTDWNQPRDKGPTTEDYIEQDAKPATPRGRRPKRKFGIERRMAGEWEAPKGLLELFEKYKDWNPVAWYEKAKQRDQAIEALRKNQPVYPNRNFRFEYRPCERE